MTITIISVENHDQQSIDDKHKTYDFPGVRARYETMHTTPTRNGLNQY